MKNKIGFIFSYFWLFLLLVVGIATLIFSDKEERVSESEKRMLAGFPDTSAESIFSGDFSSGFESFLSDGIFLRDSIANASESVLGVFSAATYEDTMLLDGIAMADEISGKIDEDSNNAKTDSISQSEEQSIQADSSVEQTVPDSGTVSAAVNAGGYGLFLQLPDGSLKTMTSIGENNIYQVAQTLNAYKSFLPEDGKVFYSCVPLTSYRNVAVESGQYMGWYENLDEIFPEYLVEGAYMVSAANAMNEALMDEHLYFQADHHWTPRGAWYLAREMMEIQGVPVVPYDEYEYRVNYFQSDPLELMYPLQGVSGWTMPNRSEREEAPFILYDYDNYVAYLAGDNHTWVKYDTGFSTGRKALVIGDSFSNAFLPYLMPYYDTVHKTDVRYHNDLLNGGSVSTLIGHYGIDDVYIILSYDNGVGSTMSTQTLEYLLYDY